MHPNISHARYVLSGLSPAGRVTPPDYGVASAHSTKDRVPSGRSSLQTGGLTALFEAIEREQAERGNL